MQQISDLMLYLKEYSPRILSVGLSKNLLNSVKQIGSNTAFEPFALHIGYESQSLSQLRFLSGITLFLIHDLEDQPELGNSLNCIVQFPKDTDISQLLQSCRTFIENQSQLFETSYRLMDAFLSQKSLQEIVDLVAEQIENPVMILDNSYRVLCGSKDISCDDLRWQENLRLGYCSYEFVSHFNRINEIRSAHVNDRPFMAGCLMSPLRHCISPLYFEDKRLGYLLSIESSRRFNETMMLFLKTASRLISKMMTYSALEKGTGLNTDVESVLV
ncbi:MAG TPA: hypothetical protein VM577_11660, partial [Anaerovoracaceae bacterium]|nr:hypothetical protein [Anaerovoracaceae bacterium]